MMSDPRLLRIARELRYRPLPALIGRRVALASLASIEEVVRGLAWTYVPLDARWQPPEMLEGALAKYGLIDTELAAPEHLLDAPDTQRGLELLKQLGFLVSPEELAELTEAFGGDGGAFCFEQLIADLDTRSCVLKLFLQDEIEFDTRNARNKPTRPRLNLPDNYFPRELVVIDACVTNAGFVWFHKHFYL
jgi:hypothetical protein